jgi:hypothetical protein
MVQLHVIQVNVYGANALFVQQLVAHINTNLAHHLLTDCPGFKAYTLNAHVLHVVSHAYG